MTFVKHHTIALYIAPPTSRFEVPAHPKPTSPLNMLSRAKGRGKNFSGCFICRLRKKKVPLCNDLTETYLIAP